MEPKIKFLSWAVGVIGIIAIVAIVMVGVVYRKVIVFEQFAQRSGMLSGIDTNSVVVKATEKKEFVGIPTSASISLVDGKKIIELRGHVIQNPNAVGIMATVSPSDTTRQKIAIGPTTRIIRATRAGKSDPVLSDIAFDTFSIGASNELYVASYEVGDNGVTMDTTPATILHIYGRASQAVR